jgi:hypothetical protein
MQTETREDSTKNKDMLILIPSAVQHTKEEITENSERVNNLTQRTQKNMKTERIVEGQKQ